MNLVPLMLHMEGCATQEEMNANVTASIERGYVRFNEHLDAYKGCVSIVGSAPSLASTIKDLKGDVLAVNGAIGYLLDHWVVPKFGMIWDASPLCVKFVRAHQDITYFVGARCHPEVFKAIGNCKTIVWHAGGDHNINEFLSERNIMEPLVNGGSAGVTRALYLVLALGYREIHLHGADSSCNEAGGTHVTGSLVHENLLRIWLGATDEVRKEFLTTPEMCAQVEEFKSIYLMYTNFGVKVVAHGQGLLPTTYRRMKADFDRQRGLIDEAQCEKLLAA